MVMNPCLIDLNSSKNLAYEPQAHQRTYRSCHTQHGNTNKCHVAKVQHVSDEHFRCFQTPEPEQTVNKGVECRTSGCEEGEPPPPVIFRTELVVGQKNSDFGTCDN